jgi:hypothetical protein
VKGKGGLDLSLAHVTCFIVEAIYSYLKYEGPTRILLLLLRVHNLTQDKYEARPPLADILRPTPVNARQRTIASSGKGLLHVCPVRVICSTFFLLYVKLLMYTATRPK